MLDFAGKLNVSDPNYTAALEGAVISDHSTVVQSLLDHGCDANAKGPKHASPLDAALARQRFDVVTVLVAKGARFTEHELRQQAMQGNAAPFKTFLDAGADVEAKSNWGNPLLILAVRSRTIDYR
jgi:ankyrin repeat protein